MFYLFILYSSFFGFKKLDRQQRVTIAMMGLCAGLTLVDSGVWFFDGRAGTPAAFMVRLCNFLLYGIQYVLVGTVAQALLDMVHRAGGKIPRYTRQVLISALAVLLALLVISQFTGWDYSFDQNRYVRGPLIVVAMGGGVACLLLPLGIFIANLKKLDRGSVTLVSALLILCAAAALLQLQFYGFSFTNIGISMGIMVISSSRNRKRNQMLIRQQALLEQQAQDLQQAQLSLMRSQIKPHFLFNSLAVIRSLCQEDAGRAVKAIDSFSMFLRRSINVLDREQLISFREELELVNSYLFLEQARFPDAFDVELDLDEEDFMVPALSIQPLVENAIKHGIRGRGAVPGKGRLYIGTEYLDDAYVITIQDNGIGFDLEAVLNDGKQHTGMNNVRLRLQLLVNGRLDVLSMPGKGTTITVTIPLLGAES